MAKTGRLVGKLVVLTGGSGFLGEHVAQALLERGARLRIASRNPRKAFRLRPLANLGQIQFVACDVRRPAHVAAALAGAEAAVNLVGSFEGDLMALMAEGGANVAEAARAAGARAMVHVSAIGADASAPAGYARAKAKSEEAVHAAFPGATIVRPSVLFGEDDRFVQMFAGLISNFPVLPVFGPHAPLQPLFVSDAADAIVTALADPRAHGGKTFEIGGPETITMHEQHRRIAAAQHRKRSFIEVPDALSALFTMRPGTPMNSDQWLLLKQGNVVSGKLPGLKQLGIVPRPLALFLDRWMVRFRRYGRFNESVPG
jgi:NADH dehydrogenase